MHERTQITADAVLLGGPYPQLVERLAGRRIIQIRSEAALDDAARAAVRVMIGVRKVTGADMDAYPNLGLIVSIGAGHEGVDKAAAAARGIRIATGSGANAQDVADMAVGLLIAAARRMFDGDARVRSGAWLPREMRPVRSLGALSVGIVGLGAIGRAVAERLAPFRCEVAWTGPRPKAGVELPYIADLVELARRSDALVIAAPLDATTAGMVDAAVIDALGPEGIIVNVARGGLVDEDALIAALREGRLRAAALDVFAQEPTPPERWRDVPNVILSPHTAAVTHEALAAVFDLAARHVTDFLDQAPGHQKT